MSHQNLPSNTLELLPKLNQLLLELLPGLQPADWDKSTIAPLWTIKDVVAHLLDGNIRVLSMLRDGYTGESFSPGQGETLVQFLNGLNADWVKAMKRVSPAMLILLHEATGHLYHSYYASLDLMAKSPFAVDWAGEAESSNRMHIAREYTEKWVHQQQIRDALGDDLLMKKEFFYPAMDIFMQALPHTYRNTGAAEGTIVRVVIPGDAGGYWNLIRMEGSWVLDKTVQVPPASELIIESTIAWKLFSKSIRPEAIKSQVKIIGDQELGATALSMIAVMA